jgi:hypothetical protein
MKKSALLLVLSAFLGFGTVAFAQVVTSSPVDYNDPTTEVKIIVNLAQLDQTKEYVLNLIADAQSDSGIYIWTWKPFEWPIGSERANGSGDRPWQNSNELLRMTKESDLVYSFTMVPTEFYSVDAATVYEQDIHFLIKPKNGGGYGEPDRKSDDLLLEINPPNVERTIVYSLPSAPLQDDIVKIVYDNYREEKVSMQNLAADDCFLFLEATLTDGSVVKPTTIFLTGTNPEQQMKYAGGGIFEFEFIPEMFLNLQPGQRIDVLRAIVVRRVFFDGDDRVDMELQVDMTCG